MLQVIDRNDEKYAWEQLVDESDSWYDRFHCFLLMGPSRTIPALVRSMGGAESSASSWYQACKKFSWRERCVEWDRLQQKAEREVIAQARLNAKLMRMNVSDELLVMLKRHVCDLDGDSLSWQTIGNASKSIISLHREAYDDTATVDGDDVNESIDEVKFTLNIEAPKLLVTEHVNDNDDGNSYDETVVG